MSTFSSSSSSSSSSLPSTGDSQQGGAHNILWIHQPSVLVAENAHFIPRGNMSMPCRINALTRLVFIVVVVLMLMQKPLLAMFVGIISLVVILGISLAYSENYESSHANEHFSLPPATWLNDTFPQTPIAPVFAEEQQILPPSYDVPVDSSLNMNEASEAYKVPKTMEQYPSTQYITRTNLLPSQETDLMQMCGGGMAVREFINSAHTRNDVAFRENLSKLNKRSMERRTRHNTQDTFSPYYST